MTWKNSSFHISVRSDFGRVNSTDLDQIALYEHSLDIRPFHVQLFDLQLIIQIPSASQPSFARNRNSKRAESFYYGY